MSSMPPATTNPLKSLAFAVALHSRDWALHHRDAWIWGIVQGWDEDSLRELARQHRWEPETVERLKLLHRRFIELEKEMV
jgi:hypothetical protein